MKQVRLWFLFVLFMVYPVSIGFAEFGEDTQNEPELTQEEVLEYFEEEGIYKEQELIVKFVDTTTEQQREELIKKMGVKEILFLELGQFSTLSVPKQLNIDDVIELLLQEELVEFVEPSIQLEHLLTPKDPGYSKQWYLKKIQMPKAWDITKGSSKITVAVIDTGIQTSHPEFKGKIVKPYDVVYNRKSLIAEDHGTHVAGIIGAKMDGKGVTGVAPNVKIMPINVFYGNGTTADFVAAGIEYAVDNGADIINLSLGSPYYSYIVDYYTSYALSKGVLVIAASGNSDTSRPMYPAAHGSVVAVSATNKNDVITSFSNYGNYIDVSAPGQSIYSTKINGKYGNFDGTSMAAPVVSGVAALIKSRNPYLSPHEVYDIMSKSAKDLGAPGWDQFYGYGRVDAQKALANTCVPLTSIKTPNATFTAKGTNNFNILFTTNGQANITVRIKDSNGKVVKKFMTNRASSGGKQSFSWDGKLDNGTYANGNYVIEVKMSNGKFTNTKTKKVKVVDKAPPILTFSKSSYGFSPKVKNDVKLSFELNRKATVTAKVYDANGNVVRTILNNKSLNGGKRSVTWNGKNSKGNVVKDGTYTIKFTSKSTNNLKSTKSVKVVIDSKVDGKAKLSSTTFKSTGENNHKATLEFTENLYVSTFIINDKGTKIRQLTNNKLYKPKTRTFSWDGKNDKNKRVAEGTYRYLFEIKDKYGNTKTVKSSSVTVQDWSKPTITKTTDLEFVNKGTSLSIPYELGKAGKVTIQIHNGSTLVRELETNVSKSKGAQQAVWNGKNAQGQEVADGVYRYTIKVVDKYGQQVERTRNITVAFTNITITAPDVVQYDEYESVAEVFYELSDKALVTIKIFDNYGEEVYTVHSNVQANKGINQFIWDGKTRWYHSWDLYGYTYEIQAKPLHGGKTTKVTGAFSNYTDPKWLLENSYQLKQPNSWYTPNELLYKVKTSENVTLKLTAYRYWGDYEVFTKTYSIAKNKVTDIIYKKDANEDEYYYYNLLFTDRLGNKYFYSIEE
ncbi:S8 family serine peptidase [Alkalihalobacillus sp. LMS39]|uniref:S8 family serine peptidase n=1 Tax=Alkalihalobacillus sp. LMS39 TaxID=2924032 RepID=UPI001FB2054A|nr:S8 family serine peptidase [Alkalihalobacillus sp. LMS39]UOE95774.1 S8 family serine peptidase [Alkalihalobacillus sp. LMS39]